MWNFFIDCFLIEWLKSGHSLNLKIKVKWLWKIMYFSMFYDTTCNRSLLESFESPLRSSKMHARTLLCLISIVNLYNSCLYDVNWFVNMTLCYYNHTSIINDFILFAASAFYMLLSCSFYWLCFLNIVSYTRLKYSIITTLQIQSI